MSRQNRWSYFGVALLLFGASVPPAQAHGSHVQIQGIRAYELQATYDSGIPMKGAQVSVFHEDDPKTAIETGITDDRGRWLWIADREGEWTFQVRQAGHGSITQLEVDSIADDTSASTSRSTDAPDTVTTPAASATSTTATTSARTVMASAPLPRWIALLSVIWGAVGTALFFARPAAKPTPRPQNSSAS